jgi:hypothetical protein
MIRAANLRKIMKESLAKVQNPGEVKAGFVALRVEETMFSFRDKKASDQRC